MNFNWIFGALLGLVAGGGGAAAIVKATSKPCPACNCPPATEINLQGFDPGKIVNKKSSQFTYAPNIELKGTFYLQVSDSTLIKSKIEKLEE